MTVVQVGAEVVRPLRASVLRPGQPARESVYQGDDDLLSAHVAVCVAAGRVRRGLGAHAGEGDVVAVGTVLLEAPPWETRWDRAWRIRGMATHPDRRRSGLGTLVLAALVDHVAAHGGGLVWCNARVRARALYERAGFEPRGAAFDLPGLGPHLQMWRSA